MKKDVTITNYEVLNDVLLVAFKEQDDVMIELKKLRMNCPCASCQGETDALGNVYRGPQPKYSELSFQINGIQPVGYYGICLLYTSPSPRDMWTSRMPSSA